MPNSQKKILVVDDHPLTRGGVKAFLEPQFDVYTAGNIGEADRLMELHSFDCALIDVQLGEESGIKLARRYAKSKPRMGIILITANPGIYYYGHLGIYADYCLSKAISPAILPEIIENVIWWKTMPRDVRKKICAIIRELKPHQRAVKFIMGEGAEDGAERIEGRLAKDGRSVALSAYNLPKTDKERNVIGVASTLGCAIRCVFCRSGRRRYERQFSVSEILAQFLHGLKSYHARGVFEGLKHLVVNFTAEGDSVTSNLDNCCQAIKILSGLKDINLAFILTTVGNLKNLKRFLAEYIWLPVIFYWSVNFSDEETRAKFMPGTKDQSLIALRDIFQQIAEITKRVITVSWILIKGVNDRDVDITWLKETFGNRPFEIKVMALEPGTLEGSLETTTEDVDTFIKKLEAAGLPCRQREIVGGAIQAGCGTTLASIIKTGI